MHNTLSPSMLCEIVFIIILHNACLSYTPKRPQNALHRT
jgi:hypothetical protein